MVAGADNSGVFMGAYDGANGLTMSRTENTLNARINNNELLTGLISPTGTTLFSASRLSSVTSALYSGSKVVAVSDSPSLSVINASEYRSRQGSIWLVYQRQYLRCVYCFRTDRV
jgi:hypothetical protein